MTNLKNAFLNRNILLVSFAKLLLFAAAVGVAATAQSLDRISCVTKSYATAGTDTCRAFLTSTNNTHVYIALSSNNPAVQVPGTIMVSYYAGSKGFYPTISNVTKPQTAVITARLNGVSKSFSIALSPPSTSTPAMSVNATSIGFGSVALNSPQEQSVRISSTGTAALTVSSAAVSGTGFSLAGGGLPATLAPGQSMTLQVQFDPTKAGSYTGQLSIASNASTATIPLAGAAAAHQVELSWSEPAGTGNTIVGFNVYRSASGSSSFARVNPSPNQSSTYTDGNVQSGTTYAYKVTSVDSAGRESTPSSPISIAVP